MQTIKDMVEFAAKHNVSTDMAIYTMGAPIKYIIYDGECLILDEISSDAEDGSVIEEINGGLTIKQLLDWCTAHNIEYADTKLSPMGAEIVVYGITPSGLIIDETWDDNEVVKWYYAETDVQIDN